MALLLEDQESAAACRLVGRRRLEKVLHPIGLGNDRDPLFGDREAAGAIVLRIEADVGPGGMCTPLSMIARRTRACRPMSTPSNRIESSTWA